MQQRQQTVPDSNTRPIFPTSLSAYLDELQAYNTCEGNDQLLDLSRLLWESDAYYPYIVPIPNNIVGTSATKDPNGYAANFAAGETQTGAIQVPANSWLVQLNGVTFSGPGFKFRVYDKATQSDLFYGAYSHHLASTGQGSFGAVANIPYGPRYLLSPFVMLDPGILQVEITNLDTANAELIQLSFVFAVPKNAVSMNVLPVTKGS